VHQQLSWKRIKIVAGHLCLLFYMITDCKVFKTGRRRGRESLLAGHGGSTGAAFQLLCFLDDGAKGTEPVHYAVIHIATLDALGLPDLAPDLGSGPDADGSQKGEETVEAAALANSLGVLAGSQARHEVGDDAQAAVVEAAEQTVGPLTHDDGLMTSESLC